MDTALLLIIIVGMFFVSRIIVKQNQEIVSILKELKENNVAPGRQIHSPNRLEKADPNITFFDENNPLSIPKNVKFEVEGGDNLEPAGYTDA